MTFDPESGAFVFRVDEADRAWVQEFMAHADAAYREWREAINAIGRDLAAWDLLAARDQARVEIAALREELHA